jgi:hypothetical protein
MFIKQCEMKLCRVLTLFSSQVQFYPPLFSVIYFRTRSVILSVVGNRTRLAYMHISSHFLLALRAYLQNKVTRPCLVRMVGVIHNSRDAQYRELSMPSQIL